MDAHVTPPPSNKQRGFTPSCHPAFIAGSGFTLIELSVVLVIIGLVVGGIVIGKEMVAQGHIRKTVSQIEKINLSVRLG